MQMELLLEFRKRGEWILILHMKDQLKNFHFEVKNYY